jgi:apolipoprotein N-acyltransferase
MPRRPTDKLNSAEPQELDSGRVTLALGLLSALVCYLAHPPVGLSLLAWIGPAPWLVLARLPKLPGRRPYWAVWLSGAVYWAATVQWIRLPHWANHFGLLFLAAYLGAYLPVFMALTRIGVHRLGCPLWLAAPVAWTGLEWVRARLLTGFLMASLAHTQVGFPSVIQIADIFGEYGVTFLIMLVAAAFASAIPLGWLERWSPAANQEWFGSLSSKFQLRPLVPAALLLVSTLWYGRTTLMNADLAEKDSRTTRIALIQSDMLADWKGTPERDAEAMDEMFRLSQRAVASAKRPVDLVVWPETMYRDPLTVLDKKNGPPAEMFRPELLNRAQLDLAAKAAKLNTALLVGVDRLNLIAASKSPDAPEGYRFEGYNSAVLVDRHGKMVGAYDKMHLLPFGEFIPLVDWLPFLLKISPVTGTSLAGGMPEPLFLDDVQYNVNICYETVLPQLIRQQFLHAIGRTGQAPDVMVNLTNDAWYWGSSELDMHLASGVFRAIEMRTPLVIAANRGLSAYVDAMGRVVQATERDKPAFLVADVTLRSRAEVYPSLFAAHGEWFAMVCVMGCVAFAIVGGVERRALRFRQRE